MCYVISAELSVYMNASDQPRGQTSGKSELSDNSMLDYWHTTANIVSWQESLPSLTSQWEFSLFWNQKDLIMMCGGVSIARSLLGIQGKTLILHIAINLLQWICSTWKRETQDFQLVYTNNNSRSTKSNGRWPCYHWGWRRCLNFGFRLLRIIPQKSFQIFKGLQAASCRPTRIHHPSMLTREQTVCKSEFAFKAMNAHRKETRIQLVSLLNTSKK